MSLYYDIVDSKQHKLTQPAPKNGKEDEAEMEPQQINNDTQQHAKKVQPDSEDVTDAVERGMATYACK